MFVDEFQDLNPLQHRLLLAWLGTSTDLCVVGDPHQAIYGWNGSDPLLLEEVPRRWPTTTVVRLDDNHRCTEQIVAAASALLGAAGSHLRSSGRQGPDPEVLAWPSEVSEARGIAASIAKAHTAGRPWSSMAVLARTNAQLLPIEDALASAGVPVHSPSRGAILDDPVARKAIADLRRHAQMPILVAVADLNEMAADPTTPPRDAPTASAASSRH